MYVQKLREGVAAPVTATYGGFWIRLGAYLIDAIILFMVENIVMFAVIGRSAFPAPVQPDPEHPFAALAPMMGVLFTSMAINTVITAAYFTFFWGKMGASPGMLALGLKVVRPNGAPISFGRALGRYFGTVLSSFTLCIGFIIIAFDQEKRALHDMICDTRVVKTRA